jgi:D-lactate dehydrogenase (cytochrome)
LRCVVRATRFGLQTSLSRFLDCQTSLVRAFGKTILLVHTESLTEISKKEMDDLGLFASILGHIGDGNFHESIMYNSKDPKERAAVEKCVHDMVDRALEMEGTCTGEHGIGLGKKASLQKELGLDTINVMRSIKGALDPYWLMNPGKIMDALE